MNRLITDEVKAELRAIDEGRDAILSYIGGAVRGAGELEFTPRGFALSFRHCDGVFVEGLSRRIAEITGVEFPVESKFIDTGYKKGLFFCLSVPAEYSSGLLEKCAVIRDKCSIIAELPGEIIGKKNRAKAFLRGLFLSCGRLNVPDEIDVYAAVKTRSGYGLELALNSDIIIEGVRSLLAKIALVPKKSVLIREKSSVVYVRNAEVVCSILAALGAEASALRLQEIIIGRQMKNDVNRINNFDLANIDKSVKACERQARAAARLLKDCPSALTDELAETCRMRLSHPTLGLEALGSLFSPPISKSCVNHRMRRIAELAGDFSAVDGKNS